MEFVNLTGEAIEKHEERLMKKHNLSSVFHIKLPLDDEGKDSVHAFLKKPNRNLIGASMSFAESDPMKSNEMLLEGCWLEGDERIKTDDDLFVPATLLLGELVKFRKGTIEKKLKTGS